MRLIDADELKVDIKLSYNTFPSAPEFGTMSNEYGVSTKQIKNAPTIETKQIKYFDEEEKVWKIGSVIVDD